MAIEQGPPARIASIRTARDYVQGAKDRVDCVFARQQSTAKLRDKASAALAKARDAVAKLVEAMADEYHNEDTYNGD